MKIRKWLSYLYIFSYVLLSQQAHHDRFGHGKQQQDQLGDGGQTGDDRHRRDRLQRRQKGPRSRRLAQRLLHQIQILSEEI